MAKYEVLEDSIIGSGLAKAGSIIEYDGKSEGLPGRNLRLIKDPVKTQKVKGGVTVDDGGDEDLPGAGSIVGNVTTGAAFTG